MTTAEFKKKWSRYHGKEASAYQEHFTDLCRLLGQPTPNEADRQARSISQVGAVAVAKDYSPPMSEHEKYMRKG